MLREPMPFYLVTQTSLIEAENEHDAARKGIDQIRSGVEIAVAVRSDEANVTHIVVAAKSEHGQRAPAIETAAPVDLSSPSASDATPVEQVDRKLILKRMIGDAVALLSWKSASRSSR